MWRCNDPWAVTTGLLRYSGAWRSPFRKLVAKRSGEELCGQTSLNGHQRAV